MNPAFVGRFAGTSKRSAIPKLATAIDRQLRVFKPRPTDCRIGCGGQLYLRITPAGFKYWQVRVDVMRLKLLIPKHPAWIICSPEYIDSYNALLKNTFDWASIPVKSDPVRKDAFRSFVGKVVGVLSAFFGALGGLRS